MEKVLLKRCFYFIKRRLIDALYSLALARDYTINIERPDTAQQLNEFQKP